MAHVGRAFNLVKGVGRGFVQDLAAAKAMRDSYRALREQRGALGSSFGTLGRWLMADDVVGRTNAQLARIQGSRYARRLNDQRWNRARGMAAGRVFGAQLRRASLLGGGIYGALNVPDVVDRLTNPNRGFFQGRRGDFDLPMIPFV